VVAGIRRAHHQVTFAVLALGIAAFALLQSLVVPVLTTVQHQLHTSQDTVTWVLTAYLLSASIMTPILGRVGDMTGKKRVYVCLGTYGETVSLTSSADGLTVYGDLSVSYHLEAAKVPAFYVKFRNDNIEMFTHGFLRNVARDAINRTGSQYTVQEIMGEKKSQLELDSRKDLQAQTRAGYYGEEPR